MDPEGNSQARTRHEVDGVDLEGISQARTRHEDASVLEVGHVTVLRNHMLDIGQRVNFASVRIHLKMMFVHLKRADLVKRRGDMSQVDDCLVMDVCLKRVMDVRLRVLTKRIPQDPLGKVDEFEQGKLEIGQTVGLGNGILQ